MLKNHQMYFHVFCQIFNQLYDLYANLMNFFLLIFTVLFISSSDRVEWNRAVSTKLYAVEFRPRTFYSNVYQCYHYDCFARCGGRAILFLFFLSPKLYKLENIIFGFNNTPFTAARQGSFFFLRQQKRAVCISDHKTHW